MKGTSDGHFCSRPWSMPRQSLERRQQIIHFRLLRETRQIQQVFLTCGQNQATKDVPRTLTYILKKLLVWSTWRQFTCVEVDRVDTKMVHSHIVIRELHCDLGIFLDRCRSETFAQQAFSALLFSSAPQKIRRKVTIFNNAGYLSTFLANKVFRHFVRKISLIESCVTAAKNRELRHTFWYLAGFIWDAKCSSGMISKTTGSAVFKGDRKLSCSKLAPYIRIQKFV